MTTKKQLAGALIGLSWGDLMETAYELACMWRDKEVRPRKTDDIDFARLLHDWAETTLDQKGVCNAN